MSQSNDSIYALINALRLEIKGDIEAQGTTLGAQISKIDTKLDNAIEQRIVPIEKDVSKLKIDSATGNVKLGVIIFIGSSAVSAIITLVMGKVVA